MAQTGADPGRALSVPPTAERLVKWQGEFTNLDIPAGWIGAPIEADVAGMAPVIRLTGSVEQRIARVENVLSRFKKYGNYFGSRDFA